MIAQDLQDQEQGRDLHADFRGGNRPMARRGKRLACNMIEKLHAGEPRR